MSSYKDLLKQREELERQISDARKRETTDAVSQVRSMIADFGLTPQDIFPAGGGKNRASGPAPGTRTGAKVAPKYRNPETGATWTGRGKAPKWIDGKERSKFAIKAEGAA